MIVSSSPIRGTPRPASRQGVEPGAADLDRSRRIGGGRDGHFVAAAGETHPAPVEKFDAIAEWFGLTGDAGAGVSGR